jgi:hypothetical protein
MTPLAIGTLDFLLIGRRSISHFLLQTFIHKTEWKKQIWRPSNTSSNRMTTCCRTTKKYYVRIISTVQKAFSPADTHNGNSTDYRWDNYPTLTHRQPITRKKFHAVQRQHAHIQCGTAEIVNTLTKRKLRAPADTTNTSSSTSKYSTGLIIDHPYKFFTVFFDLATHFKLSQRFMISMNTLTIANKKLGYN